MKLSLDDLENYGNDLNAIANEAASVFSREAKQYIAETIEAYGEPDVWDKDITDGVRAYIVDLMMEKWTVYGDASSSVGSLFFEKTLGDEMPEKAMMLDHTSPERCEQSARYWMKNLFGETPDVDKFIEGCSSFVERNVSHAADMAVLDGSLALGEEGKHVKFGRVPVGPTCGFCIMLASRGFVYASKRSAGDEGGAFNRFHDKCNCRVVAGYEGLEVEGYDYKGMYDRYKACRETIGGLGQIEKDWKALTPEERNEYGRGERVMPLSEDPKNDAELRKRLGSQANGFNDYLARRIVQEMDVRDRKWLYDGTPPEVDYSISPLSEYGRIIEKSGMFNPFDYRPTNIVDRGNEWRDLFAHAALSQNGYVVKTRPGKAMGADGRTLNNVTTPDIEIGGKIWEIKSPPEVTGNNSEGNLRFIENAMRRGRDNFKNPYDYINLCGLGDMTGESRVVLNLRYRCVEDKQLAIDAVKEQMKGRVKEVLIVFPDGSIYHCS